MAKGYIEDRRGGSAIGTSTDPPNRPPPSRPARRIDSVRGRGDDGSSYRVKMEFSFIIKIVLNFAYGTDNSLTAFRFETTLEMDFLKLVQIIANDLEILTNISCSLNKISCLNLTIDHKD